MRSFILGGAPIGDLKKVVLSASRQKGHVHPLTGAVFRRIVRDAIRERKRINGTRKGRRPPDPRLSNNR
ncbi:MAG TPA: hypothetical protein VMG09_14000 [Bacteroidota bacterium]|nr:hypothetical protein [Bacteroidota bacterium]